MKSGRLFLAFFAVSSLVSSCQPPAGTTWQSGMLTRLDSMIVLSESHLTTIVSLDTVKLAAQAQEMRQHMDFFETHVGQTDTLYFDRSVYTGPLFDMANCDKYYQRVLSGYLSPEVARQNAEQLKDLRATVKRGDLDSATAVTYFIAEAQALNSANTSLLKSYGGCFACMRTHDSLSAVLDSLTKYLLEEHEL